MEVEEPNEDEKNNIYFSYHTAASRIPEPQLSAHESQEGQLLL
jgi:hypothetical protein